MKACPNLNDPFVAERWAAIKNNPDLGLVYAMQEYLQSVAEDREMGTVEQVKEKVAKRFAEKTPEQKAKKIQRDTRTIMEKSNDPVFTDPETGMGLAILSNPINGNSLNLESVDNTKANEVLRMLSLGLGINYYFISPQEATELTSKSKNPWSTAKGKAFFYRGNVYFVGTEVTTSMAFHEFSHPVVKAIAVENPQLFNKLVAEALSVDPTLLNQALSEYKDLEDAVNSETDPVEKQALMDKYQSAVAEEILVKALTKAATEKYNSSKSETAFGKFLKNLMFAIKQFLRKMFGKKINISKLDSVTSLNDLADMLSEGGNFNINTSIVSQEDIVAYLEDRDSLLKDLKLLSERDIADLSSQGYDLSSKYVRLLIKNKNYKALADLLADEYGRGELQEIKSNLSKYAGGELTEKAEELILDLEKMKDNVQALTNTMLRLDKIMDRIQKSMDSLEQDTDSKENLRRVFYFEHFITHWKNYMLNAKETMDKAKAPAGSSMYTILNRISTNIQRIEDSIMRIRKAGAGDVLFDEISDIAQAADEQFEATIKTLEERGASQRARDAEYKFYHGLTEIEYKNYKRLKSLKDRGVVLNSQDSKDLDAMERQKYTEGAQITKEKMDLLLSGALKDAHYTNSFFEGYMYNTDPVIASFASFLKRNMTEVDAKIMNNYDKFLEKIMPLIKKNKIKFTNIGELGERLGFIDIVGGKDEKGNLVKKERWSLIGRFKNNRFVEAEFDDEILKLKAEYYHTNSKADRDKLSAAIARKKEHFKKWWNQEFIDDVYELDKVFNKGPNDIVGQEALRRREDFFDRLNNLTAERDELDMLDINDQMNELWRDYRLMHSLRDIKGNMKVGEELEIAQRLNEYKAESGKFYEYVPRKGVFENTLKKIEEQIADKLKEENFLPGAEYDSEFAKRRKAWIDANTTTSIKDEFYERRAFIHQEIERINSTLKPAIEARLKELKDALPSLKKRAALLATKTIKELEDSLEASEKIKEARLEMYNLMSEYKDDDGQVIGDIINDERISKIKSLQEKIDTYQEQIFKPAGLTPEQKRRQQELYNTPENEKRPLTRAESNELARLSKIKAALSLEKNDLEDLYGYYNELSNMQSKKPTDYYMDALQFWFEELNASEVMKKEGFGFTDVTEENYPILFSPNFLEIYFEQSTEFKEWWDKNHISKTENGITTYKPIAAWTKTIPSSSEYYNQIEIKDENGNIVELIPGKPKLKYFARIVKKEFRTGYNAKTGKVELIPGLHVDNKGNFLPKELPDSPYRNEKYYEMKEQDPDLFELLEAMTEMHLDFQKGSPRDSRTYLDFPRFPMSDLELVQKGGVKGVTEGPKNFIQRILQRIRDFFMGGRADFEAGSSNWKNAQMKLVKTDMFDNKIETIPVQGLYDLTAGETSTDIITSMLRYMQSLERQKKLIEINPIAIAIKSVLNDEKNKVREFDELNRGNFVSRQIQSFAKKKGTYVRAQAFNNYYEREFLGEALTGWGKDNAFLNNFSSFLFKRAGFSFFALNATSAIKNTAGQKFQAMLEAVAGTNISVRTLIKGEGWAFKTASKISYNVYNGEAKDVELLLVDMFDPMQGRFKEKFGTKITRTMAKDIADRSWLYNFRKWGEIQATLQTFAAMMYKQKVTKDDGSTIEYMDAWEVRDGKLQLIEGVDPEWGITYDAEGNPVLGNKFIRMRNKIHQVMNDLNGAYSQHDQPEAHRHLWFKYISNMRRYFTTMAVKRFSKKRLNVGIGGYPEGYYLTAIKSLGNTLRDRNIAHMKPEDRAALMRTTAEFLFLSLLVMAASSMVGGWDPDDEDRYAKLRKKTGPLQFFGVSDDEPDFDLGGFVQVHSMLLLMQIRSENEQFIPLPGYGFDDLASMTDLKSIAFGPTTDTYKQIINDMVDIWEGNDKALYERRVGPYEWQQQGGLKLWAHIAKMFGITGSTVDPVTALKNYYSAQALSKNR